MNYAGNGTQLNTSYSSTMRDELDSILTLYFTYIGLSPSIEGTDSILSTSGMLAHITILMV